MKSVPIWSFSGLYFRAFGLNTFLSVFRLNAGKNRPEKLRTRTLFTQCTSLSSFRNVCKEALSKVAPLKQKYIRVNNGSFMNKHITKTIMKRITLRNNYLKKRCDGNRKAYNSQRNLYVSLLRKVKLDYYKKLNHKKVSDNKTFWKTVKPLFYEKRRQTRENPVG